MEVNQIAMRRCDILKGAVSQVLSETMQSKEATLHLQNAFPNYSFTDEVGTTDSILAGITRFATDIALNRVDNLISQNNVKLTLDAIDAQFLGTVIPENASADIQTPITSLPKATLTDLIVSCKKKELDKLKSIEKERMTAVSELQGKVNTHMQEVGSLHGEISSFSQNAEEVFDMDTSDKE